MHTLMYIDTCDYYIHTYGLRCQVPHVCYKSSLNIPLVLCVTNEYLLKYVLIYILSCRGADINITNI